MNRSLLVLLSAKAGARAFLMDALAAFNKKSVAEDDGLIFGESQGDAFLDGTAHGEVLGERDRFDAFIALRSATEDFSAIAAQLAPVCDALRPYLDAQRTAVLAGVERSIIDGDGIGVMIFAFRRKPGMSQQECQRYWHDHHGAIVRRSGSGGYRQLHVDSPNSANIACQFGFGVADYDGAVLKLHRGVDALHTMFSNALVRTEALPDERVFIDHAHSGMVAYRPV